MPATHIVRIAVGTLSALNLLSVTGLIIVGIRRVRRSAHVPTRAAAVLAYLYVAQYRAFAIKLFSGVRSHGIEHSRLDDWLYGLNLTLLLFPALPFELVYLILYHRNWLGSKAYWIFLSLSLTLHGYMAITTSVGIIQH